MSEDFYRLPKKRPSENYKSIFFEASYFLQASLLLKKEIYLKDFSKQQFYYTIGMQYASEVNHAYAFELYLKCIMIIENNEYFSGHNLYKLYLKLNQKTQKAISDIYISNYQVIKRDKKYFGIFNKMTFTDLLQEVDEPFVDLRYQFDNLDNNKSYDLWDAIECLIIYIKEIKPDIEND